MTERITLKREYDHTEELKAAFDQFVAGIESKGVEVTVLEPGEYEYTFTSEVVYTALIYESLEHAYELGCDAPGHLKNHALSHRGFDCSNNSELASMDIFWSGSVTCSAFNKNPHFRFSSWNLVFKDGGK